MLAVLKALAGLLALFLGAVLAVLFLGALLHEWRADRKRPARLARPELPPMGIGRD